ncbi:uncharacterized protein nid2a isoform X1 [Rhincodon typus]|uniref:uncharacterized protein nid2a isoform X1 n=1 Tax=Rhincodon typus TaxID=259920 RepID=UPI00202DD793|nr:uncharacterized protein nid2a isoform X1 [Rhincodon typus]
MQGKVFTSLFKLHWFLSLVSAIEREELFPFGPRTQDLTLQQGDDETSQVVQLKRPFVFYDTQFSQLYVGTNGIISTKDLPRETQYVDDGFPTDFPVIAPYLSDIDTSNDRGRIYYRQDHSSDILDRAGREIRKSFPQSSFTPTNAFIATWENVAPYEEVSRSVASSDRFNTFQALLAFDESNTYAIFLYPEGGLQFFGTRPKESYNVQIELPARVGFSRGETGFILWRSEGPYYSVTSNEQSVKNLYQMGNSGTRGVWVFHIGGTSSFNNIIPANVGGTPSREDSVVTLDSTLSGPVMPNILESEYTDNEDYKQYYDDDEDNVYTPSIPTEAVDGVHGIPENPPYPDGGIIPSYPEGYPEAGIVSSYPETGAVPSFPERQPEVMTASRYSEVESLLRNPLPVTHDRHVVSVEEDQDIGTGVFTYNTGTRETCERNQGQCSQQAYCADYSTGFCCHCHSGYYGNGRECLPEGVTQRVNGKVNGKLIVGANQMPVEFRNADLHAYVVVNDGRAFTAISQIPEVVGWAMQSLSIIGDLFGWLFAVEQPGFKNGFSIAGAKFIRNVDIIFYPGNEKLNIMQIAQGLDTQNYLSIATEIEGELPEIAEGAKVQIQPYDELYHRSSSAITSATNREYSVETRSGETRTLQYQLRQNITYYDCEHAPRSIPASQQLNVDRIFVLYNESEKVVRYAMINQIGPARGNSRPETVNPCQDGSHTCDPRAQCFPINEREHICKCAPGYEGDGKFCSAVDQCTEGLCHPHATCYDTPGSYVCRCNPGYEGDGTQCRPIEPEPPVRSKTACEELRDEVEAEFSPRGPRPHFGMHVPQCDEQGNFRSLQCHSSTGQCWCVDAWGREFSGTRTQPGNNLPECGHSEPIQRPKTACEQYRERLKTELSLRGSPALTGIHIPECDDEGNFRPLQCHGSTGHCWCVYENGQEIPGTRTPPGSDQPQCGQPVTNEHRKTACEQHRDRLQAELSLRGSQPHVGAYIPQCDEEGNFRPLQCHGSTGHCWCVDERGQEIPGTRTPPGAGQPQCGQPATNERSKTACEQHRERLQIEVRRSQPIIGIHIPECDEEGNFKPLQCDSNTGYCWCMYDNGQEIPGTRTPPGTSQPQCGQPATNERPKTACEQHRERLQTELRLRGSQTLVGIHIPECDEEGNFRRLQCQGSTGYCWCVYENGQEIPGTRIPPGTDQPSCEVPASNERSKTACEQHRERLQTELSLRGNQALVGIHIPECDEEGKFRSVQCHGSTGHCWCVYENGQEIPGTRTAPGSDPPRCGLPAASERPKSACEQHRERLQTQLRLHGSQPLVGIHIPECDEEGNFRPLQCHSSSGHCWCVYENGQEIPGTRTPPGTDRPQCGQPATDERPRTVCEQYRERLQAELSLHGSQPLVGAYIPECDEEGKFRPLQCHGSTDYCWCVDERGQEIPGTRTPPGAGQPQCGQPEPTERPKTTCEQHRDRLQAELNLRGSLDGAYIPQCDEEGNFTPLQCHSSTGHCWCVDERGQEIPGTRTPPGAGQPQCGQPGSIEHPRTACEQHRDRLQAELSLRGSQPLIGAYIPECDEEGNFRPLQCHGSTGYCWCVDERGQEIPGTRTPPGAGQPQCGQPGPIEHPRTACEQYRERLQAELNLRGLQVGVHIPECDEEGNFKPLQCHSSTGHCWCVDETGQEIPDTRTPPGSDQPLCGQPEPIERTKTACEQYRDRLQAELSLRGSQPLAGVYIPQCDEEGNFRPLQCHGSTGHCWCVDERGQEIRGTRTPPGASQPQCGQPEPIDRPRTVCEQYRERLQAELSLRGSQPLIGAYIPECDEEGNFRPLQCHGSTGHCWCVDERGQEIPGTRTPPGAGQPQCGQPERIGHPKTVCEQYRERLQAELNLRGLQVGVHIPECDEEGNFRPLQCHSSTGHCWCVDERGQEIPGTRTPPGAGQPQCGQPEPRTACEQYRERLQAELNLRGLQVGVHIPECDEEGNFRPLQCHSSTGHCWCVDERGQEIPGTRTPPGTGQPQCGHPAHVEGPKTVCEQHRERMQAELNLRGSQVGVHIPECDEEGNFRPLQCHGSTGHCWCVDERGQEIPGTRTPPGFGQPQCGQPERTEPAKTACEQHRDRLQAELSLRGSLVGAYIPQCDEEGNFRPLQCHSSTGHCWCVDERGQEIPGTRTPPGAGQPQCGQPANNERPKTACEQLHDRMQAELRLRGSFVGAHVPQCDEEGNFRPLQCHGSTGHCWCVDERGQEIRGTRTQPGAGQPQCGQPEPTQRQPTVCERWRLSLLEHYGGRPANDQYIPECDESGDFSPLQCHGNSGYCWCVDKEGREIQGTRTEHGSPPACIPTVAPPITQPSPAPVVTPPSTGTFLLYAQGQHIGYLPLNGTQLNKEGAKSLLALHGSIVIGIDYDCRDKMVYWTDVSGRTINRASLEPGAEPETIINSDLISPEGLTIDYLHRNMFWTDSGLDKIEVAKMDGSERRVLVDTDLVNPRAIAVDSLNGNLYWTDWNREAPKIETSRVDGTNRRVLVKNDIGLPNGLTFDPFSLQLCWADAGTKDLECIFSDGTGRHVVQRGLNYPFSIVAYANHFYYTDWRRDGIIVVSKDNNQITDEYLPNQRSHLYGITVAYPRCPHGRK